MLSTLHVHLNARIVSGQRLAKGQLFNGKIDKKNESSSEREQGELVMQPLWLLLLKFVWRNTNLGECEDFLECLYMRSGLNTGT